MFTQLHIPADQIAAEAERTRAALAEMTPGPIEPAVYAARVIAQRLRARPQAFLEFGPYWWAVKAALRAAGEDLGSADDEQIRQAYGGDLPALEALVAGELFKDFYRRAYLAGAAQFWLDDEAEESYVLFDANMEARRLGPGALAVDADLNAQELPAQPENENGAGG